MPFYERSSVVPTRFYSLAEAEVLMGISADDLLRLGGNALLDLCVPVPVGRRAFAVDPASIVLWDAKALVERHACGRTPNKELGMPARCDDVAALILNPSQCYEVVDYGMSRQVLFASAYALTPGRRFGLVSGPARVRPVRMPLYQSDGRTPSDQSTWRFATYSLATPFFFVEGTGYPEPEDLSVTPDAIRILGRELIRLPKPIELSPLEVDVASQDVQDCTKAESESSSAPLDAQLADVVSPHASADERPVSQRVSAGDATPAEGTDGRAVPPRTDVIRDDRGPVVLLPREEVERRINKRKSWIYERTNKKHPNYNPNFPQPIKIGGNVGWIESEIETWNQEQVRRSRGG